jgi:hypothetical protein
MAPEEFPRDRTRSVPIRLLAALTLALIFSMSRASAEESPLGTVQICRLAGIIDVYTGKPIVIPRGATFVDNGMLRDPSVGDNARRVRIATIEAAQIAATAACTVARAQISKNMAGIAVRAADGRRLSPSPAVSGGLAEWPGNLYLFGTIASDFR